MLAWAVLRCCFRSFEEFQCLARFSSKAFRGKRKPRKKGASTLAFPPKFMENLKRWEKLLKTEIDTNQAVIRECLADSSWSELYKRGLAVGDLRLVAHTVDPFRGRLVDLEVRGNQHSIGGKFKRGVPLVLCSGEQISHIGQCVLLSVSERKLRLKLEGQAPELSTDRNTKYTLIPSTTAGVLHSLTKFISEPSSWKGLPGERILQYAYRALTMPTVHHDRKLHYIQDLNEDQQRAVAAAMNKNRPIVTIQGPPGTGKTAVVIEIILQALRARHKILVCAPSNLAIENIMARIRGESHAHAISLDPSFSMDDDLKQHKLYDDLQQRYQQLNESRRSTVDQKTTKRWLQEANRIRDAMKKSVISDKQVILCTISSGSLHTLGRFGFVPDLVIVDEAAQAMECATWIPLLQAPRCVLAGDHCQLPAVLHSNEAVQEGLGTSLMETLNNEFGSIVNQFLSVQHRANANIMRWSADYFYESKLKAHSSVAQIKLSDVSAVEDDSVMNEPLLMVDTLIKSRAHPHPSAKEQVHQQSYRNQGEASIVCDYVRRLLERGVRRCDIGVISPYFAQVELLRKSLDEAMVNTVDGFQGQEREVIVMSLVRNNNHGRIGFLSDKRRLNVAITRARRQFVLVASSAMMQKADHLRTLLNCINTNGVIVSSERIASILRLSNVLK